MVPGKEGTGMNELEYYLNQWLLIQFVIGAVSLGIAFFVLWLFYVYVTSRRDWFEEDIRVSRAEASYNLARAEQVRLETVALKDRLEKNGVEDKSVPIVGH